MLERLDGAFKVGANGADGAAEPLRSAKSSTAGLAASEMVIDPEQIARRQPPPLVGGHLFGRQVPRIACGHT
jgi:hypothetical protein